MNISFRTLLVTAAIAGLAFPSIASAQRSAGGVVGEARLHPGTWNSPQSTRRTRTVYRPTETVIVQSEPAPTAVAQAPTEQRRFSLEPSQQATSGSAATQGQTAPSSSGTTRRFSYEPEMSVSSGSVRMRTSNRPAYLLPKTDPNKFRVN